jgi:hypothetical protein
MTLSAYADVACVLAAMRHALVCRRLTMHCGRACVGGDGEDQLGVAPVVDNGSRVGVRKREHLQKSTTAQTGVGNSAGQKRCLEVGGPLLCFPNKCLASA